MVNEDFKIDTIYTDGTIYSEVNENTIRFINANLKKFKYNS